MTLCATFTYAYATEIHLLTTDYPPYFGSSLPNGGPITEIVVEAYKKVGYRATIEFVPWVRGMEYAKAGKVDGLQGAWHSRERERWFVFSDELPGNELVLFKRKGTQPSTFTSYADLKPYTIGIVREYRNPVGFETADLRTDEAHTDATNLKKLVKGRVDLILIDRAVADHLLATKLTAYRDSVEAVEPPVELLPLHIMISREVEQARRKVDDFNRGLGMLESEGGVQEIVKRHGLNQPNP
jgi:polar amino acid transport system substrate-binding protein